MLDMGTPVRILDLARDLLRLSGKPFRLGETVVISGLRPGEKLHEELAAPDERALPTSVERVSVLEMAPGFSSLPFELVSALSEENAGDTLAYVMAELDGWKADRAVPRTHAET